MFDRLTRYRPPRTDDNEGGFTETYSGGSTIWGAVEFHENTITLSFLNGEDVAVMDVIDAGTGEYYRVTGWLGALMATHRRASLERTERPIAP